MIVPITTKVKPIVIEKVGDGHPIGLIIRIPIKSKIPPSIPKITRTFLVFFAGERLLSLRNGYNLYFRRVTIRTFVDPRITN